MESLGFASAWPLLLLTALPVVWSLAVRSRAAIGRGRTLAAAVLRCGALALIALAMMRPALRIGEERISVVYAVDISRSVSPAFVDSALDWIADSDRRHRPAHSRVLAFADQARLVETPDALRALTVSANGDGDDAIDQSATDLEQALAASVFGFAQGHAKRLVLFTDGNATGGDVWRALPRLQAEGIRVYALPATPAAPNDAWIDDIRVPEDVRQQQPLAVEVRIFAQRPAAARVELVSGERRLGTRTLRLSAGENIVSIPARLAARGANELIARVAADGDEVPRNDSLTRSVWVGPRPRVLYVEHNGDSAHYLSDALRGQGMSVTAVSAEALPEALRRLDAIDAVILSDVPAERVDAASAARLETFVRDRGGGLVFAAGENTYGQEGFASTAVERLLPVRFEAKRKRKDLDLVLLIDRSHSMRGRKLELAKSAALASLDLLEEQHRLAVIAFDARPHDVVPLAAVGSKRRAEDLIAGMTASGQTNIYNALLRAQSLLADSTAATRHVILLSDGITAPPPGAATVLSSSEAAQEQIRKDRAETIRQAGGVVDPAPAPQQGLAPEAASATGGFPGIVAELAAAKVTLSTVAIGKRADLELMSSLAQGAGGRHYAAQADAEIPGLFVAETRRLLGESVVETPFRPIVKAKAGAIAGLDFAAGPALQGFVIGRPKRFSDVLLEAQKDKPLLAQTRYGLGKTVAFLSDVKNRWAVDWLTWPGYGKLWAQVVRDAMRRDSGEGLAFRVTRDGREAAIALVALDAQGNYRNSLAPRVRVVLPGGEASVVPLRQIAPGQYHARMPLARAGAAPWRFELLPGPGIAPAELARAGTRSLFYAYSDEYRSLPPDVALLRALSEQTGGAFAPEAAEIFRPRGDSGVTERPLWPWFAALALVLYLLDLLVRRAP